MAKRANGDGGIYKIESKKLWAASVTMSITKDGLQKRKVVYGKTRAEVKEKLRNIQAQNQLGIYADPTKITVEQMIEKQINDDYTMGVIQSSAYSRRNGTLRKIQEFDIATMPVQKVQKSDIINVYRQLVPKLSQSYLSKVHQMLKKCFTEAFQLRYITTIPTDTLKTPKSNILTRETTALTVSEQKKFLSTLKHYEYNHRFKSIYLLMLSTGMRCGEVCALSVNDYNKSFKTLSIHKTISRDESDRPIIRQSAKTASGNRILKLSKTSIDIIETQISALKKSGDYKKNCLLFSSNGKLLTTNAVNTAFKSICKKYDISDNVNVHMLRHTFATRFLESGGNVKVLSQMLGHSSITITLDIYSHVLDDFADDQINNFEKYLDDKLNTDDTPSIATV